MDSIILLSFIIIFYLYLKPFPFSPFFQIFSINAPISTSPSPVHRHIERYFTIFEVTALLSIFGEPKKWPKGPVCSYDQKLI
jgi:hypothetical protein